MENVHIPPNLLHNMFEYYLKENWRK